MRIALLAFLASVSAASAQTPPRTPPRAPLGTPVTAAPPVETPVVAAAADTVVRARGDSATARRAQRAPSPFRFGASVAGIYDTNLAHDEQEIAATGVVTGVDGEYRHRGGRALYTFVGEVAAHSYSPTQQYNRISSLAAARAEVAVTGALYAGLNVDLSFNGRSEDRVLNDQLMISPRVFYRFANAGQLRLFAAHRIRRSDRSDHTSTNQYVAALLRTAGGGRPYLELSSRYELNHARLETGDFSRWTHGASYTAPLGSRAELGAGLKYMTQRYPHRLLDDDVSGIDAEEVRTDRRWTPQLDFAYELTRRIDLELEYEFERRFSNDPGKEYQAHNITLLTRYRR